MKRLLLLLLPLILTACIRVRIERVVRSTEAEARSAGFRAAEYPHGPCR